VCGKARAKPEIHRDVQNMRHQVFRMEVAKLPWEASSCAKGDLKGEV
jgi:hypothetical protein